MMIGLAANQGASAQEPDAGGAPRATEAIKPAAGNEAADFQQVLTEWKAFLKELGELQAKYQTVPPEQRAAIEKTWKEKVAEGEKKEAVLIKAAMNAYAAAPNADKQITELLVMALDRDVRADDYDAAMAIGKLLMDNKCKDKRVANLAGRAAFAVSDLDAAEKWLSQAKKEGSRDPMGKQNLELIPVYRELWAKEQKIREAEAKADDLPRVLLKTSKGDIEIELFENEAPNTVANFISLVEKGFYDGTKFHRVIENFMAQGGDPTGTGAGGPGYTIDCECGKPNARMHFRGTLSMAHAGKNTGGSQFFLTFLPTKHLDKVHTAFGRVIKGFDVLAKIQRRDPDQGGKADTIVKAEVVRKRPHEYKPVTHKKDGE